MPPTTHFLGPDNFFKKGPMYQYLSNMQKRRNSWKVKEMKMAVYMEHPFLNTIEEIFGSKVQSTIRMYAIKMVSSFFSFYFPLYRQDLLPFTSSELLRLHPLFCYLLRKNF